MRWCVLVIAGCLVGAGILHAAEPPGAAKEPLPADSRLDVRINLRHGRVYLGDLLAELSRASKAEVSVSEAKGPVDGIDLTAYIHERPVREVMTGLSELLSTGFNRWNWQVATGKDDLRSYVLSPERTPQESGKIARDELTRRFHADVAEYYRIARLQGEERVEAAKGRPDLFVSGIFETGRPDIFAALTPGELKELFEKGSVGYPESRLAQGQLKALKFGIMGDPALDEPLPWEPVFRIKWERTQLGPMLWVENGRGHATNVVGGTLWDAMAIRRFERGWSDSLDEASTAFRERFQADEAAVAQRAPKEIDKAPKLLQLAAEKQKLNVLADLVYSRHNQSMGTWIGTTADLTAQTLVTMGDFSSRKQGETWLLRDITTTSASRAHLLPLSRLKALRKGVVENGGYLSLQHFVDLLDATPEQFGGLTEEYPDLGPQSYQNWRGIFDFYRELDPEERRRLQSKRGLELSDTGRAAKVALLKGESVVDVRGLEYLKERWNEISVRLEYVDEGPSFRFKEGGHRTPRRLVWTVDIPGASLRVRHRDLHPRQPLLPLDPP